MTTIVFVLLSALMLQDATSAKSQARDLIARNPLDPGIEKLLQNAIADNPGDPEAHYLYGQWAILNHQEQVAIREETRTAALSPHNPLALMQAWTLVAIAEDTLDHEARAQSAFEHAKAANLKLARQDASTLFEYAKFLQKRGKPAESAAILAEVLRLDSTLSPAHLLKARLLEASGDRAGALREGEESLKDAQGPEQERAAHAFLARVYFATGDSANAQLHRDWIEQHGSSK